MNRVYCLYRVSDLIQSEKNDIPMQKIACRAFAEAQDWEIVREFTEIGISGYKLPAEKRDTIIEIRDDALTGKFDILLVFMFDRIGRRDDETPFVVEWFSQQGISIWSVCEGEQRFDSHVDKLINYIRFWQASGESRKISERTSTRIRQLTAEGIFTGGIPPFGYMLVHGTRTNKRGLILKELQINENEANIIQLIFDKAAKEGSGSHHIAGHLNSAGMTTRAGGRWTGASVANILKNRIYLGILHKGGVVSPILEHLIIIDCDTFDLVQELRRRRKIYSENEFVPLQSRSTFLLSGMLYCAHCYSRMNGTTSNKTYTKRNGEKSITRRKRYICCRSRTGVPCPCNGQHTYSTKKLEAIFEEHIINLREQLMKQTPADLSAERFGVVMSSIKSELSETQTQKHMLENDYTALASEYARTLRGTAPLDPSAIADMQRILSAKRDELSAKITELENAIIRADSLERGLRVKSEKYQNLLRDYPSLSVGEKRIVLFQLLSRVEINQDYQLKISYCPDFYSFLNSSMPISEKKT